MRLRWIRPFFGGSSDGALISNRAVFKGQIPISAGIELNVFTVKFPALPHRSHNIIAWPALVPKRQVELEKTLEDCKAKRAYISTFPDLKEFKKHIDNIAWETEVWIEENPTHMIHFKGPKFLTVYE